MWVNRRMPRDSRSRWPFLGPRNRMGNNSSHRRDGTGPQSHEYLDWQVRFHPVEASIIAAGFHLEHRDRLGAALKLVG